MRMSRHLQRDAKLRGMPRVAGLVIKQDDRSAIGDSVEDRTKIADGMSPITRRPVGKTSENQLASIAIENDVRILQRA